MIDRGPDTAHWGNLWDIKYKDGHYFRLASDADVIEVMMSPQTLESYKSMNKRLQGDVFDQMSQLGWEAHRYEGAGHIHIGFDEVFRNDRLLFRNFVVDVINEYELGDGILGDNRTDGYGPTLAFEGQDKIKSFRETIAKFDADPKLNSQDLARMMVDEVYGGQWSSHYQALKTQSSDGHPKLFSKEEHGSCQNRALSQIYQRNSSRSGALSSPAP